MEEWSRERWSSHMLTLNELIRWNLKKYPAVALKLINHVTGT